QHGSGKVVRLCRKAPERREVDRCRGAATGRQERRSQRPLPVHFEYLPDAPPQCPPRHSPCARILPIQPPVRPAAIQCHLLHLVVWRARSRGTRSYVKLFAVTSFDPRPCVAPVAYPPRITLLVYRL